MKMLFTLARLFLGLSFLVLFLKTALAAGPVEIEEKEPGPFRVTSASLQVEAMKAEICLFFSQPIETDEREAFLPAIDLRKDGKKKLLSVKDISLTSRALCVQNLEHRARYDFLLRKIVSAGGERLFKPYSAVFTVPDRKPFLAFVSDSNLSVLPRHAPLKKGAQADPFQPGMAHVLRSVNVPETRLILYKIAERTSFPRAWQQFKLINLSPLESFVFAREKGEKVFESDLVFDENPNVEQTLIAPLPSEGALAPGLYYLAAAPKEMQQPEKTKHGLFAGQWFLVSDLRLSAFRLPNGIEVFAGDLSSRKPVAGIDVRLLSSGGEKLGAGKTGQDGTAFLPLPDKKKEPALLVGEKETGDLDILDIGREKPLDIGGLPRKASIQLDRAFYQSGSTASAALRAEDEAGRTFDVGGSVLKLLRPDKRVYSQQTVPPSADGVRLVNVSLPYAGRAGTWYFSWQKEDGGVMAEMPFVLAPEAGEPRLDLRQEGGDDGHLRFVFRATDKKDRPLAFRTGRLIVSGARTEVSGWDSFRFGVSPDEKAAPLQTLSFMTDAEGRASLVVEKNQKWDALNLQAILEKEGASATLTVPTRRFSSLIGVKPLIEGRAFPENGLARFEIVAVDANGKRRAEGDLFTIIYEEGRRFEWFPSEGHWDYRPLPQRRRVGGGPLSVGASGETIVRWPVTTGQYVLEVTDANGVVLARRLFEAGRVGADAFGEEGGRVKLLAPPAVLEEGRPNKIRFHLASPAFVSAILYDGQKRSSTYRFLPAGINEIELAPGDGWGCRAMFRLQALFADTLLPSALTRQVDIHQPRRDLAIDAAAPRVLTTGAGLVLPVRVQKIKGRQPTFLSVVSTPYAIDERTDLPVVRQDKVPLDAEGRAKIKLNLPFFDGTLRLALMAWNGEQYAQKILNIPARPAFELQGAPPESLNLGDKVEMPLSLKNNAAPAGSYAYELHLPEGLAAEQPLKGKILLGTGKEQILVFTLLAKTPLEESVRFDVTGPQGAHFEQVWPLAVLAPDAPAWKVKQALLEKDKPMALPLDGAAGDRAAAVALLSPVPMPDVMAALQRLARSVPSTTREISLWLEATRLWQETLSKTGLIGAARLEGLRTELIRELQRRQNDDGGFAAARSGDASDLVSTAAALGALRDRAERPSFLAAAWLEAKLQNTWFGEEERAARIEALEALASSRRADLSVLRYFAETSRERDVEPDSAAILGLALAQGGDEEASLFWTNRGRKLLADLAEEDEGQFWRALRALAVNEKIPPETLRASLPSEMPALGSHSPEGAAIGLSALALVAQRQGTWKMAVNGKEEKGYGIVALKESELPSPLAIFLDRAAFLLEAMPGGDEEKPVLKPDHALALRSVFYKTDGSVFDFDLSLMKGGRYVLIVEGEMKEAQPLRLILPRSSALEISVPDKNVLHAALPWLPENLTAPEERAAMPSGAVLTFAPVARTWKVAVLVKAKYKGSFTLPFPRVLSASGEILPVVQTPVRFSVW